MVRIPRGTVSYLSALVLLVAATSAADLNDELLLALQEWEAATADVPQPLLDTALDAYRDTHNAHELEAAAELLGPVSARRLVEEYRWTLERRDSGDIELHGEPRDVTTSLFFSRVDVVLDGAMHRPAAIQFVGGDGAPSPTTIVVMSNSVNNSPDTAGRSDIRLVASVTEASDEPAPPRPLELAAVLKRWQEAVGRIEKAEIKFHRCVYDHVYRGETRSKGRLLFEAPNLGACEFEPVDADTDTRPARTDGHGGNYTLQPVSRERWQWDGTRLWVINLEHKSYDVVRFRETPINTQGINWNFLSHVKSPAFVVPGVVDVSDDFLNRFEWKLASDDDRGLMLEGAPESNRDNREIKTLQVLIDRESFRTKATRVVSAMGTKETTHVFTYVSVNDDRVSRQSWVPDVSGLANASSHHDTDAEDKD